MKEIEFEEIWLREPQPPRKTARAPFRLASRVSGTVSFGFESLSHRE